MKREMQAPE